MHVQLARRRQHSQQMVAPTMSPLGPTATVVSWPAVQGSLGVQGYIWQCQGWGKTAGWGVGTWVCVREWEQ